MASKATGATKKAAPKRKQKTTAELNAERKLKEAELAAVDLEVTTADEWLTDEEEGVKLRLPSGKVCLARNPGMTVFLEQGMIPNSLLPIVQRAIKEGKGMDPNTTQKVAEDPEALMDIVAFADNIALACVLQPELHPLPEKGKRRQPGVLYVDRIDINDKLFIMQWVVGGTANVERFRGEQTAGLEGLPSGQDVGDSA